ncbi:MAG: type II toxin-antitoxin system VapC family toxin [Opitutaceae bacterium]|nr:type II toxin-antitoxin system VapC family toxin [Opitutaceae bacterium]
MNPACIYLPDTNVFSAYAKCAHAGLVSKLETMEKDIVLSAIVLAEMEYGWRKAGVSTRRIRRQQAFAARLRPWVFDGDCAAAYGDVKNFLLHRLRPARPSGERDMPIAAHALAIGAVLMTHNSREFEGIPGHDVEDWEK